MDFSALEKNICDVIKEEQVKLGYRSEVIRLYYPLSSLNLYLRTKAGCEEMEQYLASFCEVVLPRLGRVTVSRKGERFCICLPKEAADFVHANTPHSGFLYDFIEEIRGHHASPESVIAVFRKYSDCVKIEYPKHGEFDVLLYFEDGQPDDLRYCLTDEGGHLIYHRYSAEDFAELGL